MKFLKLLPFESALGEDRLPCALWQKKKGDPDLCEYSNDQTGERCDTSGLYYGTDDEGEPKFCARHFYQRVVSGDGKSNYKLVEK